MDDHDHERAALAKMQSQMREKYMYVPERVVVAPVGRLPGPGYVCHTCGQPGHWRADCPYRTARGKQQREPEVTRFVFDKREFSFHWRLRSETNRFFRKCKAIADAPISADEASRAIATKMCGRHERSWDDFARGRVRFKLYEYPVTSPPVEVTHVRANMAVVVHRVPVHDTPRRDRDDADAERARKRGRWGAPLPPPPPAMVPDADALHRDLGFLIESAPRGPLAIEAPRS